MTPSGIEPATFRFVAQYLNHCDTISGPHMHVCMYVCTYVYVLFNYVCMCVCVMRYVCIYVSIYVCMYACIHIHDFGTILAKNIYYFPRQYQHSLLKMQTDLFVMT
jgi:hypothetical protein